MVSRRVAAWLIVLWLFGLLLGLQSALATHEEFVVQWEPGTCRMETEIVRWYGGQWTVVETIPGDQTEGAFRPKHGVIRWNLVAVCEDGTRWLSDNTGWWTDSRAGKDSFEEMQLPSQP